MVRLILAEQWEVPLCSRERSKVWLYLTALFISCLIPTVSKVRAATSGEVFSEKAIVVATPIKSRSVGLAEGYIASIYRVSLQIDDVIRGEVTKRRFDVLLMAGNDGIFRSRKRIIVFLDKDSMGGKRPARWKRLSSFICLDGLENFELEKGSANFDRGTRFEDQSCIFYGYL